MHQAGSYDDVKLQTRLLFICSEALRCQEFLAKGPTMSSPIALTHTPENKMVRLAGLQKEFSVQMQGIGSLERGVHFDSYIECGATVMNL
jgi:hypothetical protein